MKKYKILIVEDDLDLATLTSEFLEDFEFDCVSVANAADSLDFLAENQVDLVLLDLMLPDADGLDLCRKIKLANPVKVMIFTARKETIDQVVGLELGADDYVTKPIEPRLLLARCRALLRRDAAAPVEVKTSENRIEADNIKIDTLRREVTLDGGVVELNNPEYELLCLLIGKRGDVISRNEISLKLRGVEYDGQSRQIDILISTIRAKLEEKGGDPGLIKTIRAKGYVFVR